jgi:ABC-type proline/glycine betaine transport system permease subunit
VAFLVACRVLLGSASFPSHVRIPLDNWLESVVDWITLHLAWAYDTFASFITVVYDTVMNSLLYLPAPTVALLLVAFVYAVGGARLAMPECGSRPSRLLPCC